MKHTMRPNNIDHTCPLHPSLRHLTTPTTISHSQRAKDDRPIRWALATAPAAAVSSRLWWTTIGRVVPAAYSARRRVNAQHAALKRTSRPMLIQTRRPTSFAVDGGPRTLPAGKRPILCLVGAKSQTSEWSKTHSKQQVTFPKDLKWFHSILFKNQLYVIYICIHVHAMFPTPTPAPNLYSTCRPP